MKRWQRERFPWFAQMNDIFGSTFATGRYSFFAGEEKDATNYYTNDDDDSQVEIIQNNTHQYSQSPITPTPISQSLSIHDSDSNDASFTTNNVKDTMKRHRESARMYEPTK